MSFLEINFFNGFQIRVDNRPVTRFYSQKTKGLLVYLALEAIERPQARTHLATLLWPDYPDSRARRNLSQTLTSLRKDLGDHALTPSLFDTTTQTIGLSPNAELSIDVRRFEAQVAAVHDHKHPNLAECPTCTKALEQAADLYTGPLLNQFDPGDSNPFEEWLVAKRETLLQRAIETFIQLGDNYVAQGRGDAGLRVTDRLLELAPWQEGAHRQRMLLLAQHGRRIQALNQYDVLCDILMQELGVSPAPETDELYDQVLAGEIESAPQPATPHEPALTTALAPPFQAPATSPYFVGREREIGQIQKLLDEAESDMHGSPIALVGMGGVGKSALAAHNAHRLKERFPDGVLWGNPLTSDPLNILDVWARAYGSDFSGLTDLESKATAVRGLLAHKQALIVLDNVEDAASVRLLIPSGSDCQVLMTTRNLDAATSLNAQLVQMREFSTQSSHKLMVRIIGEKRIAGPPEQSAAVDQISRQLHHLPLAIEIAAQRLRSRPSMPLAALAMRLGDTQQRLGLKISDQAVRASFEVSWGGLTPLAQQVFAGMAVFAGRSFTAEALAAVVDLDLYDLEDELYSLAALSLVNETDGGRNQQHLLLADFAAEKLAVNVSELAQHQERLVVYYLKFVKDVDQNYRRLTSEWDNLTAVIETAHATEQWERLLDLADGLTPAWQARGRYSQARAAYRLAYEGAQKLGCKEQEASVLLCWGEAALEQNDYEAAEKLLSESLVGYQLLEMGNGIAQTKYQLARVAIEQNQFDKANRFLIESKKILMTLPSKIGLGDILFRQGYVAFADGFRLDDAEPLFAKALAKYEIEENRVGEIEALRLQAQVAEKRENYVEAESLALRAKRLSEDLQDQGQLASNLYVLTYVYLGKGDLSLAKKCGEESQIILQKTGRKRTEGLILRQLCRIYKQLGDYETAMKLGKQSLAIFEMLEIKLSQAFTLNELANLHQLLEDDEKAIAAWQAAYQLAKLLNHGPLLDSTQKKLG